MTNETLEHKTIRLNNMYETYDMLDKMFSMIQAVPYVDPDMMSGNVWDDKIGCLARHIHELSTELQKDINSLTDDIMGR